MIRTRRTRGNANSSEAVVRVISTSSARAHVRTMSDDRKRQSGTQETTSNSAYFPTSDKATMLRAFTRTQALRGPGRADVELAMSKWWTKKRPAEGQVSKALSTLVSTQSVSFAELFPRLHQYLFSRNETHVLVSFRSLEPSQRTNSIPSVLGLELSPRRL